MKPLAWGESTPGGRGGTNEWLTPRWITDRLGEFDLDPCAADPRPWDIGRVNYTERGLSRPWFGRVFCNPPYGRHAGVWMQQFLGHGVGVALIMARTETAWFGEVWAAAHSIFFLTGRVRFLRSGDFVETGPAGAPSCLVAASMADTEVIRSAGFSGHLVTRWETLL